MTVTSSQTSCPIADRRPKNSANLPSLASSSFFQVFRARCPSFHPSGSDEQVYDIRTLSAELHQCHPETHSRLPGRGHQFTMMKVDGVGMRYLHVIFHVSQNRKMITRMQTTTTMVTTQSRIVESVFSSFSWRVVLAGNLHYEVSLEEKLYHEGHRTCFFDEKEANRLF